ncbi:hypothetical protein [Desulfatibacillum aliphaticivorans]|nr:hypothetical protein [Desulfatibacillum aliphaticivorans]
MSLFVQISRMLGVEWDSLCEAQLWGLAVGGVLSRVNQESFSSLQLAADH